MRDTISLNMSNRFEIFLADGLADLIVALGRILSLSQIKSNQSSHPLFTHRISIYSKLPPSLGTGEETVLMQGDN